ncbi:MAG: hypothetical protein H7832_12220 [Magnetococcus sp. DMHC-6]
MNLPIFMEWRMVRTSGILFLLILGLGSSLVIWGEQYYTLQKKTLNKTTAKLTNIQKKLDSSSDLIKMAKIFYPRLQDYERRHILITKEPDRVLWVEALRETAKRLNLEALTFDLQEPRLYTPSFAIHNGKSGGGQLMVSTMLITSPLLHEEDLLEILDNLEGQGDGLMTVDSCLIDRITEKINPSSPTPNLSIKCTILWITLNRETTLKGIK